LGMPVPSLNGSAVGSVAHGVTATLDPPAWPYGNGEPQAHEPSD
jgi:hypothetical protein